MRQDEAFIRQVTRLVFVRDDPAPADIIFIPGSSHEQPCILAAEMHRQGFAPRILPSGRYGMGKDGFRIPPYESEWAWMSDLLRREGVPREAILREDQARCTWDNARLSREVCDRAGIQIRRALLCCRPFHARRALIYYQWAFPETELLCLPCREEGVCADDWFLTEAGRERVLGEVRRLGSQINRQLEELMADERGRTETAAPGSPQACP
ncbi:MAG: YdcF family protein [Clostridia bacterium]|nr:YdcF family protein [Clostridia bacterium]